MAKDGTMRGGARPKSGPLKKSLADKIADGQATKSIKLKSDKVERKLLLPDYLDEGQFGDLPPLEADKVARRLWDWLVLNGIEDKVSTDLIVFYSVSVARWIQCEKMVSRTGLIGKHPTTGGDTTSPFVSMSREYMRQIQATWYNINSYVRENLENAPLGKNPQEDMMESLLLQRPGAKKSG